MTKVLTPLKAIRQHCIFCSGGNIHEPKHCTITDCALYPYRLGHRPGWSPKPRKAKPQEDNNDV